MTSPAKLAHEERVCPKCGGEEILQLEEVTDQLGGLSVGVVQEPYVCGDCGLVELYVRDVEPLRAIAKRGRPSARPYR